MQGQQAQMETSATLNSTHFDKRQYELYTESHWIHIIFGCKNTPTLVNSDSNTHS